MLGKIKKTYSVYKEAKAFAEKYGFKCRIEYYNTVNPRIIIEQNIKGDSLLHPGEIKELVMFQESVRGWLNENCLTVKALAKKASVDPKYLQDILDGKFPGTLSVLSGISQVTGISLDQWGYRHRGMLTYEKEQ